MAVGIPFDEANLVLTAPSDAEEGSVYDLHVHRYVDETGNANVLSKWQLSAEELAAVVASGGVVWFNAWGQTHPPIWISGVDPFDRATAEENGRAD